MIEILIVQILSILLSLYAAYLSYSCSAQNGDTSRFMFTIIAFVLGPFYLLYYFFANYLPGICK